MSTISNEKLPELPARSRAWALFLDLDGTLVELVDHPDNIAVDDALRTRLETLSTLLDGAVAVISGRAIDDLDKHLTLPTLAMSGQHGAEWRDSQGQRQIAQAHQKALEAVRHQVQQRVDRDDALYLEDKGASLALHYRHRPEAGDILKGELVSLVNEYPDTLELHQGKFVFEIKGQGYDKGVALERFLASPPFADRCPVFIGDDRTDEDGFRTVNAHQGMAIKVGTGESVAASRLTDPQAVHEWLDQWIALLQRS
ncbi:trehalose-phosphatase [Kushneria pakistanensis]|uniref:trehalose-phosphatase n=1 Tax=Kushneria pakistanensis TaxID=1508770 RepID=UPI001674610B|nr:trehalose-phosphatase [Kushneria pakistanensis]